LNSAQKSAFTSVYDAISDLELIPAFIDTDLGIPASKLDYSGTEEKIFSAAKGYF
jgi:DNA (cytosine-5)-methyltransferase 1